MVGNGSLGVLVGEISRRILHASHPCTRRETYHSNKHRSAPPIPEAQVGLLAGGKRIHPRSAGRPAGGTRCIHPRSACVEEHGENRVQVSEGARILEKDLAFTISHQEEAADSPEDHRCD